MIYWPCLKFEFIIKTTKKGYNDDISKNIFKYFEVKFSEIRLKSENLHPCKTCLESESVKKSGWTQVKQGIQI